MSIDRGPDRDFFLRAVWTTAIGVVGGTALLCSVWVHQGCHDIPGAIAEPSQGTARAGYCDALERMPSTVTLIAMPVVMVAIAAFALWTRPRLGSLVVGLILVGTIANAIVANSLTYSTAL